MFYKSVTPLKFTIVIFFLVAYATVYTFTTFHLSEFKRTIFDKQENYVKNDYAVAMDRFKLISEDFFISQVDVEGVKSLLYKAQQSSSQQLRAKYRDELYNKMLPHFHRLENYGVNIMLFAFEDNTAFLRMHKKEKFDDDISQIRHTVVNTNKYKKRNFGFEQGKITHAYRNVYPIFYNGEYLGCIDISFSSETIQKIMKNLHGIETNYIVKKEIFSTNIWESQKKVRYIPSIEHEDYLYTITSEEMKVSFEDEKFLNKMLRDEIYTKMRREEPFSVSTRIPSGTYVISFMPVYDFIANKHVGYVVSYVKSQDIASVELQYVLVNIAMFILLAFLFIGIYYIARQREHLRFEVAQKTKDLKEQKVELEELVHSFDKNVIFSRTDLKGVITHVSEAFCKISGYTEQELLGKAHSKVRHVEMSKDLFKHMWRSLEENDFWEGEVKNQKKDGSYYWVHSKIESEYDQEGNKIGYYAVREDITAQKEVEALKEELEDSNTELSQINENLGVEVDKRMEENIALTHEIQDTQKEVVFTMGAIGETRSKETGNHVKRVAEYSKLLALYYGLDHEEADMLKQASPMHDIGKVAIPDSILNKPAKLELDEWKVMMTHSELGYEMLKHSSRPLLKMAATVAHEHHEKWDGSGYPRALKGEDISIYGRITAIADVFDALGSDRVYKKAWPLEEVYAYFHQESGKHFDPKLIELFFENLDEFLKIRRQFKD